MSTPEYSVTPVSRLVTPQSGEYVDIGMLQGFYNTVVTIAPSPDVLFAWPFFVDRTLRVDELHLYVESGEADKSMRIGLYTDSRGRPETLLVGSSPLSLATTGDRSTTFGAIDLMPGTYWGALLADSNTAQVHALQGAGRVVMPIPRTTPGSLTIYVGRSVSVPFGALPDAFPAGSTLSITSPARLELRAA